MKILKYTITAWLPLLFSTALAQFQSPQAIELTGSGADAKLTGIQSITSADDATNANAVINNTLTFNTAGGTTNNFTVTLSGAITSYTTGMIVHFIANSTVTGAATLNVNGLEAITIKKNF